MDTSRSLFRCPLLINVKSENKEPAQCCVFRGRDISWLFRRNAFLYHIPSSNNSHVNAQWFARTGPTDSCVASLPSICTHGSKTNSHLEVSVVSTGLQNNPYANMIKNKHTLVPRDWFVNLWRTSSQRWLSNAQNALILSTRKLTVQMMWIGCQHDFAFITESLSTIFLYLFGHIIQFVQHRNPASNFIDTITDY